MVEKTNKSVKVSFDATIEKIVDLRENGVITNDETETLLNKFDKKDFITHLLEDEDDSFNDDDDDDDDEEENEDDGDEQELTTLSIQEDKIKDAEVKEIKKPTPKPKVVKKVESLPSGNTISSEDNTDEDEEDDFEGILD